MKFLKKLFNEILNQKEKKRLIDLYRTYYREAITHGNNRGSFTISEYDFYIRKAYGALMQLEDKFFHVPMRVLASGVSFRG